MSEKNSEENNQNVEIKALIISDEEFTKKMEIAKNLTNSNGELIRQKDVFFNSKNGRLKLRYELNKPAQLVYYERNDISGPKLSNYDKLIVEEPEILEKILEQSNGMIGTVEKDRYLFLYKNCRIHLDIVKGLGNFLEFEVVLKPTGMSIEVEDGEKMAVEMMKIFQIENDQLIRCAYLDKLLE